MKKISNEKNLLMVDREARGDPFESIHFWLSWLKLTFGSLLGIFKSFRSSLGEVFLGRPGGGLGVTSIVSFQILIVSWTHWIETFTNLLIMPVWIFFFEVCNDLPLFYGLKDQKFTKIRDFDGFVKIR